jgi:hypothetical protein
MPSCRTFRAREGSICRDCCLLQFVAIFGDCCQAPLLVPEVPDRTIISSNPAGLFANFRKDIDDATSIHPSTFGGHYTRIVASLTGAM